MTHPLLQILMGTCGSFGFSILFNIRGKKLLLASLGGALSWSLCLALEPFFASEPLRYFFSSCFVAIYSEFLARVMKTPAATFLIPSVIPHIPGGALYHTMRYGFERQWIECLSKALYTLTLAVALALGIIAVHAVLNALGYLLNWLWYRRGHSRKEGKEKIS